MFQAFKTFFRKTDIRGNGEKNGSNPVHFHETLLTCFGKHHKCSICRLNDTAKSLKYRIAMNNFFDLWEAESLKDQCSAALFRSQNILKCMYRTSLCILSYCETTSGINGAYLVEGQSYHVNVLNKELEPKPNVFLLSLTRDI
jgi:hypothetical protein